jgi:type I restriction enzyme M protein
MPAKAKSNGATLDFESQLWAAADKLRGHMDSSEYKHVVLGLIFLKYISDSFEEVHSKLLIEIDADPEDRDEYLAQNVFWVPKEARWPFLQGKAKQPEIGKYLDDGMVAIERDNPVLKNILPKDFARPTLDKTRLGELIDLISGIGLGSKEQKAKDVLGRVYEYFLSQFASAEGKKGGEFYTPQSVVRVLVAMLAPYKGRIFDPCCGSGGMFVQSEKFVEAHGGRVDDIAVYGQESNPTTWKLAKMNLAIRGIPSDLGKENADSFHRDLHPDLKADFILANPPFNMSDWGGERLREDKRWKYGAPPVGNANYAWVQHFIHHLAPNGTAGFVLANGSMSSNTSGEGEIRKAIIEADLVDCMVALPGQLFFSTQIPVCLWFLTRDKAGAGGVGVGGMVRAIHDPPIGVIHSSSVGAIHDPPIVIHSSSVGVIHELPLRDRRGETLFIDARKMGTLVDRVHRDLTEEDIAKIADTYHAWKVTAVGDGGAGIVVRAIHELPQQESPQQESPQQELPQRELPQRELPQRELPQRELPQQYTDVAGFCKSLTLKEIQEQNYVLTPGRYVGAVDPEEDDEPFEEKMVHLTKELETQFEESTKLEKQIRQNLEKIDYGE